MTNLERLQNNRFGKVLADLLAKRGALHLIENAEYNLGDFFEMAITGEKVKRNGLNEMSKGDWVFNGKVVEIKHLSTKTGASLELKGTLASHYLIGFNNGKRIEYRLIEKKDLIAIPDGKRMKITYQNNINKGVRVEL